MKNIIAIALLLITTQSLADTKIQAQINMYNDGIDPRPQVGLVNYYGINKLAGVSTWLGFGVKPTDFEHDFYYMGAKTELQFYFKKLTIAPGLSVKHETYYKEIEATPYLKIEYKID